MFETLSDRLEGVFKKLRGQGRITERNIDEALREVRLALLEADVNIRVVRDFVDHVKKKALAHAGAASAQVCRDRVMRSNGRERPRTRPEGPAAGQDNAGGPSRFGQNNLVSEACALSQARAQTASADGLDRRETASRDGTIARARRTSRG